jgi:ankyrin repeat protein
MSLLEALHAGDKARALELLKSSGGDANEMSAEGLTPLMWAADDGDAGLVRALLAAGADPLLEDRIGETALVKAAAGGHRKAFDLLAPFATEEQLQAARAYLRASGKTDAPPGEEGPSALRTMLVDATANLAKFLGDDKPAVRVERAKRAENNRKR